MVHVVWFKRDFRTLDHAPLHAASFADEVFPLAVIEPSIWDAGDLSKRHYQFVKESMHDLDQRLQKMGNQLHVRVDEMIPVLETLYATWGQFTMHSHMEHGLSHTYERDKAVKAWMDAHQCRWTETPGFGVKRGTYVGHRPSFMKTYLKEPVYPVPRSLKTVNKVPNGFSDSSILDGYTPPGTPASNPLKGGETAAIKQANSFFQTRTKTYLKHMTKPAYSFTSSSLLSAYLTWGNISIKSLHKATQNHLDSPEKKPKKALQSFSSRVYWHCHFVEKVEMKPWINTVSKDPRYEGVRTTNEEWFERFKKGTTGFPFVDACMRFLHAKAWLNFRQRAMLTSFACNTLLLDWRDVGQFLAQSWIDYEPGIHWSQIQMQSGLIAPRHIPIYDVIKQSKETDPDGVFIQSQIPELAACSSANIHEPWKLADNPYIAPMIDYDAILNENKEKLYAIKKLPERTVHV